MKNIQVIDGAINCVYDIFSIRDELFEVLFPNGQDIEFIEDLYERESKSVLDPIFEELWTNPVQKDKAMGIHGILFYELLSKKPYYPEKIDRLARNPNGSKLR